jgi:hypothetical protein
MPLDDWLFPPQLFADPPAGWLAWGVQQAPAAGIADAAAPAARTISGQGLAAHSPAVAQAMALLDALGGRLQSAAAEEVRAQFRAGRPLTLLAWPYDTVHGEWFRFAPVVRRLADGRYAVGEPPQEFKAPNDEAALAAAQQWFLRSREEEIGRARSAAQKLARDLRREDPLYARLLERVLETDDQLRDAAGEPAIWSENVHGWWTVECREPGAALPRWRYSVRGEVATAVGLFLLVLRERPARAAVVSPEEAELLLGPAGWQRQEGRCTWAQGELRGNIIYVAGEKAGLLSWREVGPHMVEVGIQGLAAPLVAPVQVHVPSPEVARAWAIGAAIEHLAGRSEESHEL